MTKPNKIKNTKTTPLAILVVASLLAPSALPSNVIAKETADVWPYTKPNNNSNFQVNFARNTLVYYYNASGIVPKYFNLPVMYNSNIVYTGELLLGNNVFENKGIEAVSFVDSKYLSYIELALFKQNSINKIYWNESSFYTSEITIGGSAFNNNLLTELDLPTKVSEIQTNAFSNNKISTVKGLKNVRKIGQFAFSNNKLISYDNSGYRFELPENKDYDTLESYSFRNNSLTELYLPENIKFIKEGTFENNPITAVFVENPLLSVNYNSFSNYNGITFYSYGETNRVSAFVRNYGGTYVDLNTMTTYKSLRGVSSDSTSYQESYRNAEAQIESIPSLLIREKLQEDLAAHDKEYKTTELETALNEAIINGDTLAVSELIKKADELNISLPNELIRNGTSIYENDTKVILQQKLSNDNNLSLEQLEEMLGKVSEFKEIDSSAISQTIKDRIVEVFETTATDLHKDIIKKSSLNPLFDLLEQANELEKNPLIKDQITPSIAGILEQNLTSLEEAALKTDDLSELIRAAERTSDNNMEALLNDLAAKLAISKNISNANELQNKLNEISDLKRTVNQLENTISKSDKELVLGQQGINSLKSELSKLENELAEALQKSKDDSVSKPTLEATPTKIAINKTGLLQENDNIIPPLHNSVSSFLEHQSSEKQQIPVKTPSSSVNNVSPTTDDELKITELATVKEQMVLLKEENENFITKNEELEKANSAIVVQNQSLKSDVTEHKKETSFYKIASILLFLLLAIYGITSVIFNKKKVDALQDKINELESSK